VRALNAARGALSGDQLLPAHRALHRRQQTATAVVAAVQSQRVAGGLKLLFQRTGDTAGADIKLKASLLPQLFPKAAAFKARLTGADARIAGLLYPLAWFANGSSAEDVLHAAGYDVTVTTLGTSSLCQDHFTAEICGRLANQLARSIAASLEVAIGEEDEDFPDRRLQARPLDLPGNALAG
jgi:hypothetical protein